MNVIDLLFKEQAKQLDRLEYECSCCGDYHLGKELEEILVRNEGTGEIETKLRCERGKRLGYPWK